MTQIMSAPRAIRVLLVIAGAACASIAGAQTGTIAGTIVDAKRGLPLSDVTVTVIGQPRPPTPAAAASSA